MLTIRISFDLTESLNHNIFGTEGRWFWKLNSGHECITCIVRMQTYKHLFDACSRYMIFMDTSQDTTGATTVEDTSTGKARVSHLIAPKRKNCFPQLPTVNRMWIFIWPLSMNVASSVHTILSFNDSLLSKWFDKNLYKVRPKSSVNFLRKE